MTRLELAVLATAGALCSACADDGASSSTSSGSTTGAGASSGTSSTSSSTGGTSGDGGGGAGGAPGCPTCAQPVDLAAPANPAIVEASGLVASADHRSVYYVHNDSGDTPRFFAIGEDGSDQGTFNVTGAAAVDWEDIARGPCSDRTKSCLYLADIGDNRLARTSYVVYRVPEPTTLGAGAHSLSAEAFAFTYPDGPHNAEAMIVHPKTGALFVLTKNASLSQVFEMPLPLDASSSATMVLRGQITVPDLIPLITGADFRPDGGAIIVRTYPSVWLYPMPASDSVADALFAAPCALPAPSEMQGEAIAFAPDGQSYRTISEGESEPLVRIDCR